ETERSVRNTIDFLNETGPDTFAVNHWYYLHSTPIRHRAAEFDLQGEGYVWSHRTMSSDQAMEAADEIFASVKSAAWMPVNGLDFWGVPYLLGKGMTPAEIVRFLELAKPLTANRVAYENARAGGASVAAAERRFKEFCGQLPLAGGRYRRRWGDG
ncbi:MAG TPA: PhpK family radical SAM P-methyltransferase, partial [Candidatus Eisenbacteria bacterium]|nr:PhpK family radical SAM P-methyltransferase [Candidatus Eisenbacteria bacterium]